MEQQLTRTVKVGSGFLLLDETGELVATVRFALDYQGRPQIAVHNLCGQVDYVRRLGPEREGVDARASAG